jgi:hypothetical protein
VVTGLWWCRIGRGDGFGIVGIAHLDYRSMG